MECENDVTWGETQKLWTLEREIRTSESKIKHLQRDLSRIKEDRCNGSSMLDDFLDFTIGKTLDDFIGKEENLSAKGILIELAAEVKHLEALQAKLRDIL